MISTARPATRPGMCAPNRSGRCRPRTVLQAPEFSRVMLPSIVLMGGSVTAGARAQNTPGCGHLRAADADREQVIDALKVAFAGGRLTKDKFDAGIGQALTSRTYAQLAAVTTSIPAGPARIQSRSLDSAAPTVPPVLARQITHGGSIAQTARTRQWPRVLVAGLVLVILAVTLVPGEQRSGVILLGVMLVVQAAARGLVRLPSGQVQYRRSVPRSVRSRNVRAAT
jgi:Domain of unknown function (DUF1707)